MNADHGQAGTSTTPQHTTTPASVEAVVRRQLGDALGGARGMVEAAVPTILFTVVFLTTHALATAIVASVAVAVLLLGVRLAQRSTGKYVANAFVGIAVGALFAWMAARHGGNANDQALAYFLPGLLYNSAYSVLMVGSVLARWPAVGFLVGSVTGDPMGWHEDRQVVRLCGRLTWILVLPCVLRVVAQAPIYVAGTQQAMDASTAIALLGTLKVVLGWPLQVLCLAAMAWLLGRDRTPLEEPATA